VLVAAQRAGFPRISGPETVPSHLLRVLHLPGHADDALALYWEGEGVLIAGDAAQGTSSCLGACPHYSGAIDLARASVVQLLEGPFGTLHRSRPFNRLDMGGRPRLAPPAQPRRGT
jgi:hypothetical protein